MAQDRKEIVAWVGSHIIPHEATLRARLRRMTVSEQEIDDIVQDTYLSIARLESVAHIRNGRAYMFTAAKMALLQRLRRDRIIRIDQLSEIDMLTLSDDKPDAETWLSARQELERVRALIEKLPDLASDGATALQRQSRPAWHQDRQGRTVDRRAGSFARA